MREDGRKQTGGDGKGQKMGERASKEQREEKRRKEVPSTVIAIDKRVVNMTMSGRNNLFLTSFIKKKNVSRRASMERAEVRRGREREREGREGEERK